MLARALVLTPERQLVKVSVHGIPCTAQAQARATWAARTSISGAGPHAAEITRQVTALLTRRGNTTPGQPTGPRRPRLCVSLAALVQRTKLNDGAPRRRPRLSGASARWLATKAVGDSRRPSRLVLSTRGSKHRRMPNRRARMRSSSVAVEWTSAGCRGDRWAPTPAAAAADCGKIAVISDSSPKNPARYENAPLRHRCGAAAQPRQLFESKNQGVKPASKSRVLPRLALRPVESCPPLRPTQRCDS